MKSKLAIFSLLLAGTTCSAFAQETAKKYFNESWKDNFYISLGAGIQANVNPDNFDNGFGKAITPQITLSVGKWINPVWGVRGQLFGWQTKLNTDYMMSPLDKYGIGGYNVEKNIFEYGKENNYRKYKKNYIGLNADIMLNLTNLFCGYKEGRNFEFTLFLGPNLTAVKSYCHWQESKVPVEAKVGDQTYKGEYNRYTAMSDNLHWLVGGTVGLGAKYNIDRFWALDLEVRGSVTPSPFGVASNSNTDGALAATIGATYTFRGKKFVTCRDNGIDEDALNAKINELKERLANMKPEVVEKVVEKEILKEVEVAGPRAIFFEIGKAKITDRGLVNLELAAKVIKENPNRKYKLIGYADKATGSAKINQKLSKERAQAVYDALVKDGVNPNQLEMVAEGGQDNMFGKAALNRVVILE